MSEISEMCVDSDQPPMYRSIVKYNLNNDDSQPPSYFSIITPFINVKYQLNEVRANVNSGRMSYKKVCLIGCCISFLCFLVSVTSVTSIVLGVNNMNKCQIFPIWLIVNGSLAIVLLLIGIYVAAKIYLMIKEDVSFTIETFLICFIAFLLFIWQIAGAHWLSNMSRSVQHTNATASYYCDYTCYYFTLGLLMSSWLLFGLITTSCVTYVLCFSICRRI